MIISSKFNNMVKFWEDDWETFYTYHTAIQSQRERIDSAIANDQCKVVEGLLICEDIQSDSFKLSHNIVPPFSGCISPREN